MMIHVPPYNRGATFSGNTLLSGNTVPRSGNTVPFSATLWCVLTARHGGGLPSGYARWRVIRGVLGSVWKPAPPNQLVTATVTTRSPKLPLATFRPARLRRLPGVWQNSCQSTAAYPCTLK